MKAHVLVKKTKKKQVGLDLVSIADCFHKGGIYLRSIFAPH
jgi:hypothetical protein